MDRISYGGTGKENLLSHTDVFQTIFIGNNRYLAVTWGGYTLLMPDEKQPEELTSEIYNNTHTQSKPSFFHQNTSLSQIILLSPLLPLYKPPLPAANQNLFCGNYIFHIV